MSAFDVLSYKPKTMLFLVHREEILNNAVESFRKIVANKSKTMGVFTGRKKEWEVDYLFATIQSMNNSYMEFDTNAFDYIIVDEAHHAASPTYQRVLDYFNPKFLLGMTATPERCDNESIFELFDHNVALEVRLHEALDLELVIPFHYFGVTDIEAIDLSDVPMDNLSELAKRLKVNERVDFIIEKMQFYGFDGDKRKAVGFCANIDHAQYMTDAFNKREIPSICLTGENTIEERESGIARLESDTDPLEVIFTVDIFNEGVDIPSINLVLMLRPTNSPIIFIQQLGRGLRKHDDKTFLTVLDFIGNHRKAFLIAIALKGERYYDKDSLKVAVATEFSDIPGCTHIQMDRIAQERILEQLNAENFNSMKYLKEEYEEFKKMNGGKVPYLLIEYIKYDGAPDPIRFIDKEKTYIGFVAKLEKDKELYRLLQNEIFAKVLKEISGQIPIKRPYEFAVFRAMMKYSKLTIEQAKVEIEKYIEWVDIPSVEHAMAVLSQTYYDSAQIKANIRCFNYEKGILTRTLAFDQLIKTPCYRVYIQDAIYYGLIRYEKEFGMKDYGVPFFKLYEQYKMIHTALLSNYTKIHSSFRGSGLIANDKDYFLFIDLHKDEDIKDSINYKDKLIDVNHFQWQSPNSTLQSSERGQNIIYNRERGISLHIFLRKYNKIDNVIQPFIYIGKGDVISHYGEKPITVLMKLHEEMPISLYREFTEKV